MTMNFKVIFKYRNFENTTMRFLPGLKNRMERELMETYNLYADRSNEIIEKLNENFENLYPNYFEENKGKEVWDLIEYNDYMRNAFQKIVDEINMEPRGLMTYRVGDELQLIGMLRRDPKVEIEFYLKEA